MKITKLIKCTHTDLCPRKTNAGYCDPYYWMKYGECKYGKDEPLPPKHYREASCYDIHKAERIACGSGME